MAILTVGTTGATYTTLAAAQTAATADVDSIMIITDITENFILSKNIVEIYSDTGNRVWTSNTGNSAALTINNSFTGSCTVRDLIITKTGGLSNTLSWTSYASGAKVTFLRCDLRGERSSGSSRNIFLVSVNFDVTDALVFNKCIFKCNNQAISALDIQSTIATADVIRVQNSIFVGVFTGESIKITVNSSTNMINCYNNTVYNFFYGMNLSCKSTQKNNLFLSNTGTDVNLVGSSSKSDYLNCAFGAQTNDGGWDSSIIFGVTTANEVVSAASNDFNLKEHAQSIDAGQVISTITDTFNGSVRPRGNSNTYDIGATEYQKFLHL